MGTPTVEIVRQLSVRLLLIVVDKRDRIGYIECNEDGTKQQNRRSTER